MRQCHRKSGRERGEGSTEVEKCYFALQTLIFFTLQSVFMDDLTHLSVQIPDREGEKDNER